MTQEETLIKKRNKLRSQGKYIQAAIIQSQIEDLNAKAEKEKLNANLSLADAIRASDKQSEAIGKIIKLIVINDFLCGELMNVREWFSKELNLNVPLLEQMKAISSSLNSVVHTVDAVCNNELSEHYAEMVEQIEPQINAYLNRTINAKIGKALKFL